MARTHAERLPNNRSRTLRRALGTSALGRGRPSLAPKERRLQICPASQIGAPRQVHSDPTLAAKGGKGRARVLASTSPLPAFPPSPEPHGETRERRPAGRLPQPLPRVWNASSLARPTARPREDRTTVPDALPWRPARFDKDLSQQARRGRRPRPYRPSPAHSLHQSPRSRRARPFGRSDQSRQVAAVQASGSKEHPAPGDCDYRRADPSQGRPPRRAESSTSDRRSEP